jgi:hypothetical protein
MWVLIPEEDPFSAIAPQDDVIQSSRHMESRSPRHVKKTVVYDAHNITIGKPDPSMDPYLCAFIASTLQVPPPAAAKNKKMKQNSTAGSPPFIRGRSTVSLVACPMK